MYRSPKRRLACAASSSPPRKRRRASGAESWQTHRSQLDDRERDRHGLPAIYWALGCVEGKHQGVLYDRCQGGNLGMPLELGECLEHGARPADIGRPVFSLACTT